MVLRFLIFGSLNRNSEWVKRKEGERTYLKVRVGNLSEEVRQLVTKSPEVMGVRKGLTRQGSTNEEGKGVGVKDGTTETKE